MSLEIGVGRVLIKQGWWMCEEVGNVGQAEGDFINESGDLVASMERRKKGAKLQRSDALL